MKFTTIAGGERVGWLVDEHTSAQLAAVKKSDLTAALSSLLDAAAKSEDPLVARAYERYDAVLGVIQLLGG